MALSAHGEIVEPYELAHLSRAAPLAPFDRLRASGRIDLIVIPAEAGMWIHISSATRDLEISQLVFCIPGTYVGYYCRPASTE